MKKRTCGKSRIKYMEKSCLNQIIDTSGLLIVAKNRAFAQLFTSLFRIRKIHKTYHAIVHGKYELKKNRLIDDLITYDNKKKIKTRAKN